MAGSLIKRNPKRKLVLPVLTLAVIFFLSILTTASADNPKEITGKDGSFMVLVPAGRFLMGEKDYGQQYSPHSVFISDYYIDKYEVTVTQYRKFCETTGRGVPTQPKYSTDAHPIVNVTWNDATAYANYYGERLPTEAEWEKACRAGSTTKYYFGNEETDLKDYAWYSANSSQQTHSVGLKKPNAFGLYDMAGNAWEWCFDWYDDGDYYRRDNSTNDPEGPINGRFRVLRGGGWVGAAGYCSSANREGNNPSVRFSGNVGFRCAVLLTQVKEIQDQKDEEERKQLEEQEQKQEEQERLREQKEQKRLQQEEQERLRPKSGSEIFQMHKKAVVTIYTEKFQGTGFFISPTYLVTCYHVIEGAKTIQIKSSYYQGDCAITKVYSNKETDVAVLSVSSPFPQWIEEKATINEGDEDVGARVISISSPKDLASTFASGDLSQIRDFIDVKGMLQITVPISPGSSGGPLFDTQGRVIGITSGSHKDPESQNINLAIPISYIPAKYWGLIQPIKPIPQKRDADFMENLIKAFPIKEK